MEELRDQQGNQTASTERRSLLMHACCGPCSMEPTRLLQERDIFPAIYYENSNIHPQDEYVHRLGTLRAWAQSDDPALIETVEVVEGAYDATTWEETAGRIGDKAIDEAELESSPAAQEALAGGATREAAITLAVDPKMRETRCRMCYRLRFEKAAKYARDHGFTALGTTLSVSPYQYTDIIREELESAAAAQGLEAAFEDYRPYYDEATRRSREQGMYRQNFCGCRISDLEAQAERAQRKAQRAARKAAEAEEHKAEREAEEQEREAQRAKKRAYNEKQARKRAILKAMREESKA